MITKTRCPRCRRKMLVESEENEQCTSETCDYFIQYPTDAEIVEMEKEMHEYANCMCVPSNHIHGCSIHDIKEKE